MRQQQNQLAQALKALRTTLELPGPFPEDVLRDAEAGEAPAARRRDQRFYANLYLSLYYESAGDTKRSLEHMTKAADAYANTDGPGLPYMAEVARVHVQLRGANR